MTAPPDVLRAEVARLQARNADEGASGETALRQSMQRGRGSARKS